jgi:death on curing protein
LRNEPIWLPLDEIIEINRDIVGRAGEPFHILELGVLEGAWAKPINRWAYGEEDIVVLAATLFLGIAQNQTFLQGNKRTAFTAAGIFLQSNGYDLTCKPDQATGKFLRRAIVGKVISQGDLLAAARANIREI